MNCQITRAELAEAVRLPPKPIEPFGPNYPALPSCAKFRRVQNPTDAQNIEHGREVMRAIRALQASALARETPEHKSPCASGTWEGDGKKILAKVRAQIRARA